MSRQNPDNYYQQVLANRQLYPFADYEQRLAHIQSVTVDSQETEKKKPLFLLILGGTNVGKSCLFNLLLGKELSPVKSTAGYTRNYFMAADAQLDPNELASEVGLSTDRIQPIHDAWLRGKVLVDSPDFDSIDEENRKRLEALLPLAHLILVVVTAAKREIALLSEILTRYQGRKNFLFLLNKQDREDDYQHHYASFLEQLGFVNPQIKRISCQAATGEPLSDSRDFLLTEIGKLDSQRIKTVKYHGDVRDRLELFYNAQQVEQTLASLRNQQQQYQKRSQILVQEQISGLLTALTEHPQVVRDVLLLEIAEKGRGWLKMLLKPWVRYRFLLALAGVGSFFSRGSGSVIPFFSGIVSGLIAQSGQINSLTSLRQEMNNGIQSSSLATFLKKERQSARQLLSIQKIRSDLHPPEEALANRVKEAALYQEEAVEQFLTDLLGKQYKRILSFLELLTWGGVGSYSFFRLWPLYHLQGQPPESLLISLVACFLGIASCFLSFFIWYVGRSSYRKLQKYKQNQWKLLSVKVELGQPFQPAIEALEEFKRSLEKAFQLIKV